MNKRKNNNEITPITKHICPSCNSIKGHYDNCWLKNKKAELDKIKAVE